ncbi:aldo/keto reductase [Streptomyces sp. NPDC026294]|uniref:aldo/keto reductase n=1 Tax=Streptomyces sp. NPDC026294 TaxID=3155362 RepID=UPI0033EB3FB9
MRDADPRVVLGLHRARHERRLLTGALDLGITALDTSFNYLGFRSHEVLACVAADLLPQFTLSTKVGYFPGADRAEHSLAPARLHVAVEQAVKDLGREPDLVFLHNPEHTLTGAASHDRYALAQACAALSVAAAKGLCGAWGVASWDPAPLVDLVDAALPQPSVLMVRAGLLVGARTLDAADAVAAAWGLGGDRVWGMSPFGGSTRAPVWDRINPGVFLRGGNRLTRAQAAFRAAYDLPKVSTIAVGTNDPAHLGELIGALASQVDEQAVREYRDLIRPRSRDQPA